MIRNRFLLGLLASLMVGATAVAETKTIRPDGSGGYRITDEKGRVKGYITPDSDGWVEKDTSGRVKKRFYPDKSERERRDRPRDDNGDKSESDE